MKRTCFLLSLALLSEFVWGEPAHSNEVGCANGLCATTIPYECVEV